jgi:hypothetical protein
MDTPLEQVGVADLRSHIDRISTILRSERDLAQVRVIATNLAGSVFAPKLTALVRDLPQNSFVRPNYPQSGNTIRPPDLDARIEELIAGCYAAVNEIEEFQRKVTENKKLGRPEVRSLVLRRIVERENAGEDIQWSAPLAVDLGLSETQLKDALQYLEARGAIEPDGWQGYVCFRCHQGYHRRMIGTVGRASRRVRTEASLLVRRRLKTYEIEPGVPRPANPGGGCSGTPLTFNATMVHCVCRASAP